jgi:hypothetical protein
MKGAPPTKHEILDQIDIAVRGVDRRGREMDQRWGVGRLPTLVPLEVADKFRAQRRKFSAAVWERDAEAVRKHGEAMLRAYAKLDEIATATGAVPGKPDQWEFETPEGLIILVREIGDVGRAELHGRQAKVWSLDEVASVIRAHPVLAAAKDFFPGATVESVRPPVEVREELNDSLMQLPY